MKRKAEGKINEDLNRIFIGIFVFNCDEYFMNAVKKLVKVTYIGNERT